MNYSKFKKINLLDKKLLYLLNIYKEENIIFKISNYPNFDLTSYEKNYTNTYFFKFLHNFPQNYSTILECNILENKMIHSSDIDLIKESYDNELIDFNYNDNFELLEYLFKLKPDLFENIGYDMLYSDIDWIKFNKLDCTLDNKMKKLIFSGSFIGEQDSIEPIDLEFYILCRVIGIAYDIESVVFYKELLSEAYMFYTEHMYKISFFLFYSAFESYVNYKLNAENESERFSDKVSKLFKNTFTDISKHQIYTSLIGELETFSDKRNDIAHGKGNYIVLEEDIKKVIFFVLTMINSIEENVENFNELNNLF